MIDVIKDKCYLLKKAGKLCKWAGPKGVPYTTIVQWVTKGVAGVRLEVCYTPQGRVTTMAAIKEFVDKLTKAKELAYLTPPGVNKNA